MDRAILSQGLYPGSNPGGVTNLHFGNEFLKLDSFWTGEAYCTIKGFSVHLIKFTIPSITFLKERVNSTYIFYHISRNKRTHLYVYSSLLKVKKQ